MICFRYEGQMLDGQPHGNGSIVYMANDKFGRANYTGLETIIYFRDITEYFSGEWRFGTITGVGTMHWKSGARYRC